MAKNFLQKLTATLICTGMLLFGLPTSVIASEISGITPNGNTYNIEAAKISGETGFREYEKFNLSQGDIANLIYKLNGSEFKNFVNLVDNQVVINGIINTMKDNNFYNGHAIFVSPNGIVIGASGVLNVGSLTLMAPSQNAYKAFLKGLSDNEYKNIKDFEFDITNGNYQSLITNSSGTININGRIFAREGVDAYARTIKVGKETDSKTGKEVDGAINPGIFAGIQNKDNLINTDAQAEALFNELVSNNITNADKFELSGGSISLVTNKPQDEIIKTVISSEETVTNNNGNQPTNAQNNNNNNTKKYKTTTTFNVTKGLKTVNKAAVKDDGTLEKGDTTDTIDDTYKESSLSSNASEITISDSYIASNKVKIQANSKLSKKVSEDTIKQYGEAAKKAASNNNNGNQGNTNPGNPQSNTNPQANANPDNSQTNANPQVATNVTTNANFFLLSDNGTQTPDGSQTQGGSQTPDGTQTQDGSQTQGGSQTPDGTQTQGGSQANATEADATSGYKIHKSDKGTAGEASAKVTITNSKIKGDTVSIKANASSSTESYIQLIQPIWEKWVGLLGADLATHFLPKLMGSISGGENADSKIDEAKKGLTEEQKKALENLPWSSKEAIVGYFSDKVYTQFDGARANASIDVVSSEILGSTSVDMETNADASLKLKTGELDSHPLFLYGLGSKTVSKINIESSIVKAVNGIYDASNPDANGDKIGTGNININAFSSINNSIDYDSSNFKSIIEPSNNNGNGGNQSSNPSGSQNPDQGSNPGSNQNPDQGSNPSGSQNPDQGSNPSGTPTQNGLRQLSFLAASGDADSQGGGNQDAGQSGSQNPDQGSNPSGNQNPDQGSNPSGSQNPDQGSNPSGNQNPDQGSNPSGDPSSNPSGSQNQNNGNAKYSAYNITLFNNSIISDNEVVIQDDSKVEAANVNVRAIGYNKDNVTLKNTSNVGKDSSKTGIALGMLINHSDTQSNILVDNSEVKANYRPSVTVKEIDTDKTTDVNNPVMKDVTYDYGSAKFISQNLNNLTHKVTTKVQAKDQKYTINEKELNSYEETWSIQAYDWLNKKILGKVTDKIGDVLDKLSLELSGSAIWNEETNLSTSVISNSKITADKVTVQSNILDFVANSAISDASANEKFGAGAAVIVNDQKNTNGATIMGDSEINARSKLKVDAETQMPMNPFKMKIGETVGKDKKKVDVYVGVEFDQDDEIGKVDADVLHTTLLDLVSGVFDKDSREALWNAIKSPKETIGSLETSMDGLFNNLAKAEGKGQMVGIAGSVVANSIQNDTTSLIQDSTVNVDKGDAIVNAANSIVNSDGAGKVDFLFNEINALISKLKTSTDNQQKEEGSKIGIGGSVLVDHFTNNATSKIINSKVKAGGDVDVQAASEEGYINLAVTGGKAGKLAVDGSVNVQRIDGKTTAAIENNLGADKGIEAKNVNVTAGKARISTRAKEKVNGWVTHLLGVKNDKAISQDDTTHELKVNDERDVNDSVLNITIIGANSLNSNSTTVAAGVSVSVSNITKEIISYIDKSIVTATKDINVLADTSSKKIDILEAAAFIGGAKTNNSDNSQQGGGQQSGGQQSGGQQSGGQQSGGQQSGGQQSGGQQSGGQQSGGQQSGGQQSGGQQSGGQQSGGQQSGGQQSNNLLAANNNQQPTSNDGSQQVANIGGWRNIVEDANDGQDEVSAQNNTLEANNASRQAQTSIRENQTTIRTSDNTVDQDGQETTPQTTGTGSTGSTRPSNASVLTDNQNSRLEGDNNETANTTTAKNNFSLALAGAIDVTNDKTKTTAKITNSEINSGENVTAKAENDMFAVQINGALAKAGTAGAGAGVNVYTNKTETKSLVENSVVNFTSADAKGLDVASVADIYLIDVTAGVGAAADNNKGTKAAVGGSFGWNTLKNKVNSTVNKSTVKKQEGAANPDVSVDAIDLTKIWNVTGAVAVAKGGSNGGGNSTGIGAGIAATVNYSSKDIVAEVIESTLNDVKDVRVLSNLQQDYNTIAIAAAIVTGSDSSYTFDGAVNTEVNTNKVTAKAKNSKIVSNGDVTVYANETVKNQSLAGGLDFSTSSNGFGVGIGAVVNVNHSEITAESDNLKVEQSNSIDIKAKEIEDLKFLAVNLGIQTGGGHTINVNGIANVFVSEVVAHAINNSVLNSTGNVGINSIYDNTLQGITAVAGGSMDGNAIGANLLANVYNNHVTAELQKGSKINTDGDASINARASEDVVLTPVGLTLSNGGSAVAANINANVFVDTIKAQLYGEVEKSGNVLVNASDITSLITRGGTLKLSNGGSAIGGSVNVDVLDKTVTAEIKDTTVNSSGDVDVFATSINSFGGTKKDDGTYDVATIDDAKKITEKDSSGKIKDFELNDNFKNWNMFYDFSASFQASVSGEIVVKVVDNEVRSTVNNSAINSNNLNVRANDYTVANAIIGMIAYGGSASVGANVFVLAGSSDVKSNILNGSKLNTKNTVEVMANSTKKSTLISVAGGASGTASVNGSAVANVINDKITAQIDNGVSVETDSLAVKANSDNDIKGLLVNASAGGSAGVGAAFYVNKQNSETTAKIGEEGTNRTTIKAVNNVTTKATADDKFSALLVNVAAGGSAGVGAAGVLNFVDSTVQSGIYNSDVTSENDKVEVLADRGFNRQDKLSENQIRSWFKDTSTYKQKGKADKDGKTDTKAESIKEGELDNLAPKVGIVAVSAAGVAAVSANVISNKMVGNVTAEVKDSNVSTDKGLNVDASQTFTNYDLIAAISGSGTAAINAVGVINVLEDNITAQLDNAIVTKGGANVDAKSEMDLNQLVVSGAVSATGASVNATVDVNKINDKVYAYVKNGSEIHGKTTLNAEHAIEINNILLAASASGMGFAGSLIPVINTYTGDTIAQIIGNVDVNDGDISINAYDNVDNFTAIAGFAGVGIGASVNGFLIRNDYENTVDASIKGLTLDTTKDIKISSISVVDSENALLSAGFGAIGANASANIIINLIDSTVSSYIDNAVIKNAGNITLVTNKDTDGNTYQDHIHNLTGNVGVAGIGGSAAANVIYNIYENTTESYVKNSDIQRAVNLLVEAHGDKLFKANNYGVSAAGIGGGVQVNAVANQIESETKAYVLANYKDEDGNAKDINVDNEIKVIADDKIVSVSDMGFAGIGAVGAGAGANVNVSNYNEIVSAEILSDADNKVNAKKANVASNAVYALKNTMSGVAAGIGAIAGDISVIQLGKREYVDSKERKDSSVNKALSDIQSKYDTATSNDGKFNATKSSKDKTGVIARVNGNLTTTDDITLSAETDIKGIDKDGNLTDTLTFDNTNIAVGGIAAGVGVKLVNFSNSTDAEIAGGNVKAGGNININAESVNDVKMTNQQYTGSIVSVKGAVGVYDNKALTNAKVTNADVNAKNININAKSSNKADISSDAVTLSGMTINVSVAKVIDKNLTNAIVTGDTNITTDNLNLHATGNSDVASTLHTDTAAGADIAYISSEVDESAVTSAIIKDVNGEIKVSGLNLVADSDKLVAASTVNSTTFAGLKVGGSSSDAKMNATLQAGIDSIMPEKNAQGEDQKGLTIANSGKTIILSGAKALTKEEMSELPSLVDQYKKSSSVDQNKLSAAKIEAKAFIEDKGFSLASGSETRAKANNTVTVNSVMKANNHNADSLDMIAIVDEQATGELSSNSTSAISVDASYLTTDVTGTVGVDVAGKNTIKNDANIYVNSNVKSNLNLLSAKKGLVSGSILNMYADVKSNTLLNISGDLNADVLNIDSNTVRNSVLDYISCSMEVLGAGSIHATNNVGGKSILNFDNYTPNNDYLNKLNISHNSKNTQDTVSSSLSIGYFKVDSTSVDGTLNATSEINIKNSNIENDNDINLEVNNTNIVKDTYAMLHEGLIAATTNHIVHTYESNANIYIDNSKISANNIVMKAISNVKNAREDELILYTTDFAGIFSFDSLDLKNNIVQTSGIDVKNNSNINSRNDILLSANTDSNFNQKVESKAYGIGTTPGSQTSLNVKNTNKISIDETSILSADNSVYFDLDSSNTLTSHAYSDSRNFGGAPTANSYLTLTVDNTLDNNGTINAGKLVDIDFMKNSVNKLTQYAHTDAKAYIANSYQDGILEKNVNNLLNVAADAIISSKKDIDIDYNVGEDNLNSEISHESESYVFIFFPISSRSSIANIKKNSNPHKMTLNGTVKAGDGKDMYVKINSDGKIDLNSSRNISQNSYMLYDGNLDNDYKNEIIKRLETKIEEVNNKISDLEQAVNKRDAKLKELDKQITKVNDAKAEIDSYISKLPQDLETIVINDYDQIVQQEFSKKGYSHVDCKAIINAYSAYASQVPETEKVMTLDQYIQRNNTYNLTSEQIAIFTDALQTIVNRMTLAQKSELTVYNNTYILTPEIEIPDTNSTTGATIKISTINALDKYRDILQDEYNSIEIEKRDDEQSLISLNRIKDAYATNKWIIETRDDDVFSNPYSVIFQDIIAESSGVNIHTMPESGITGNGVFDIDSAALVVDNYSTRSLVFNSIMFGEDGANGLVINGKGYGEYLNNPNMLIGSQDGTKYISNGVAGNGDILITNYYDVLNPFASTLNVPYNTRNADITIYGDVATGGRLNIYNDTGDINIVSNVTSTSKNIVAPNGFVQIDSQNKFIMGENDNIFGANFVYIKANEADAKGNIRSGYDERKIVITDSMLQNLVKDPTTGETNMIDLGATPYLGDSNGNNIKAIYKDGQIYLFGMNDNIGGVNLNIDEGNVESTVTTQKGVCAINIDNKTDKMLNVSKIINESGYGSYNFEGSADTRKVNHITLNAGNNAGVMNINSNGGINFNSKIKNNGVINITNKDGNITFFDEIKSRKDNITVSQNNGSILNGIVDAVAGVKHTNYNIGEPNDLYKTHLGTAGDIVINVIDGDIGVNSNPNAKIGIDASTRDYTKTINVSALGTVAATAKNSTKSDKRLINLRAVSSDLNIKEMSADGDIMLTAADWNTADVRPTPNDENYYKGYSILDASQNGNPISGQSISLIASDRIGTADKKIILNQDTLSGGTKLSIEGENNVYAVANSNSNNTAYIDAVISKRGDVEFTNNSNSILNQISSGGHLHILETGKELTIYSIGGAIGDIDDILYPHDNINIENGTNAAVPQSIAIEVLDALGGDNAESTLKIYSAYVQGRNKGQGEFDANGKQIADVSLMADNIYINSANAKHAQVSTKKNSQGLLYSDNTYTDAQLGLSGDTVYQAMGLNSYGEGAPLILDVKGVSSEFVDANTTGATRSNYNVQTPIVPDAKFANANNQITDHDYRVNNAVISVNNNSSVDRAVVMNTIYADDAYIDSNASKLNVLDSYINNYAEFRNVNKKAIVDNDYRRRLGPAESQLYTAKTGSFALGLDRTINMKTTAPIVGNDFTMLANDYQSEGNFVNLSRKDTKNLNDNVDRYSKFDKQNYKEALKRTSVRFDTTKDADLKSNVKIYDLSTTGASIKNIDGLKVGDETKVRIAFDDVDVTLKSKVVNVSGDRVGVEFIDITPDVANKILYRYMQKQNTMKISKK